MMTQITPAYSDVLRLYTDFFRRYQFFSSSRAALRTASVVMPNFS